MKATKLEGELAIPASKSHTIRALLIGALAGDFEETILRGPLVSQDTLSACHMVEQFGCQLIEEFPEESQVSSVIWRLRGIPAKRLHDSRPISINVGNSGTALYLGTAVAALFSCPVHFDGDTSIRQRSAKNLLQALANLGVCVRSENFYCPYTVQGPISGGSTRLSAPTSQYLSALLLALPLASACESEICLDLLNEHPYVDMTLGWLKSQGIRWHSEGYERYQIPGGQHYQAFQCQIPADFSSATFFFCAAAITGSTICLTGLNPNDSQGDKQTLDFLQRMGCEYRWQLLNKELGSYVLEFRGPVQLRGAELDLSQTPDALPALAVACACATGTSRIVNVAHARRKETDRIACMAKELRALGFELDENPDGLTIYGGTEKFRLAKKGLGEPKRIARGYHDHRIIMALWLLNLLQPCQAIVLDDSRYAAVTYPSFFEDLKSLCV